MKILLFVSRCCLGAALLISSTASIKAATFTVDPGATWLGFMNVFNTGGPGYGMAGAGGFVFPSGWGTTDLRANFAGPVLSLQANTIGDPNPFWYTPAGGPGAIGNKIMDASFYQEITGPLAGTTVTFTGNVLANTLTLGPVDGAGHGWTSVAFVKDFAPDYSSFIASTIVLPAGGVFSVSLAAIADPLRHVQFGFETIGPNVWAGDPLSFASIDITAVPEPGTAALLLGGLAFIVGYRRNQANT